MKNVRLSLGILFVVAMFINTIMVPLPAPAQATKKDQIGQLEGLLEVAERIAVPNYRARGHRYSSEGAQKKEPDRVAHHDLAWGIATRARVISEKRDTGNLRNAKRGRAGTATREHNPGPAN